MKATDCFGFGVATFMHRRFTRGLHALLLVALVACGSNSVARAATPFSFTLSRAAHTSAGVYDSTGKLVRTLWRDVYYVNAGTYTSVWDDTNDGGTALTSGTYTIKVLAHNMNYVWEGVVGNTSDNTSGATVHHDFHAMTSLCFGGTTGFYCTGYSETSPAFFSFSASTPQQVATRFSGAANGGNDYAWHFSDSDGSRVYFACPAVQNQTTPVNGVCTSPGAVCAFNVSNSTVANFTNGYLINEAAHPFTNGILVGTQPSITGLAVQRTGNLLAVSVAADNKIYLINKTSGSVLSTISLTGAGLLAVDAYDNLWVQSGTSVGLYTNLNTTPTLTTVISGFSGPTALGVSPASAAQPNLLVVADGGTSQQLKAYNSSGTLQWTYGQAGGYATDPSVTMDKFWFSQPDEGDLSSIAFQPDGTFWVLDGMNDRTLHLQLSATSGVAPTYVNQIAFMQYVYMNTVNVNNVSHVFATSNGKWLEFTTDYTKTLGGTNGSWTLVKNWAHNKPAAFGGAWEGFWSIATLSNGRTYGLAQDNATNKRQVVELPASGNLRYTGVETTASFIYPDGSLRFAANSGGVNTFTKQALTGFDGSGNPTWGTATTIATSAGAAGVDPSQEWNSAGPRVPITSSNVLAFFDNTLSSGMHLGGIDLSGSTNAWAWESSPSTTISNPIDGIGSYGITGVNYGGALHDANGRSIVYAYKGEGWSSGQSNQLAHWYDDGLFLGQFGTPAWPGDPAPAGAAGNMQTMNMAANGGKTYVYTGDESFHGGVHRWRLDGLSTIAELIGSGTIDTAIPLSGSAPIGADPYLNNVPGYPVGVTAHPGNGKIWLNWPVCSNAVYYKIKRSTTSGNGFQNIATCVFSNCFTDTTVVNGVTYYYVISAVNGNGETTISRNTPGTASTITNIYEAEGGVLASGANLQGDTYASSNVRVGMSGGSVTINGIRAPATGTYNLAIRYACPGVLTPTLKVNGSTVTLGGFPATPGYAGPTAYADYNVSISLTSGTSNTLTFSNANGMNIDKFTIAADTPFYGAPFALASSGTVTLETENYDYGGEGASFHDWSAPTGIGTYRPDDGVNISGLAGTSNGFYIGYCNTGEWLKYTVSAPVTGTYTFQIYAATTGTGTALHLEDELGNNLTGTMTITNTGNWGIFAANTASISLSAGTHTLKLVVDSGGMNHDYMTFTH
ncbi:MAG TPA: carbohydrate-binding protein [Capsulimonadaceae bacterium]|jgi:hypothetical protein